MEVSLEQYLSWCLQLKQKIPEDWTEEPVPIIEYFPPESYGEFAQWSFSFGPPLRKPGPETAPVEAILTIRPEAFPAAGYGDSAGELFRELGIRRWQENVQGVALGELSPMTLFEGVTVERPAAD